MIAAGDELRLLSHSAHGTSSTVLGTTSARINDMAWCATPGYEQYVACAAQDGAVQLWDLEPTQGTPACHTLRLGASIQTVAFHAKVPKLLLAVDASGVGRLIDWLASISNGAHEAQTTMAFADPSAVALHAAQGVCTAGRAAWQAQDPDVIGALLGTHWSVWNVGARSAHPTRPLSSGTLAASALPGPGGFAFSPTNSRLFAVYAPALSPALVAQSGAGSASHGTVHIYDAAFPQNPRRIEIQSQTPQTPAAVDLATTGTGGGVSTLPSAYSVAGLDWLPQRVGAYDVLLVAIGTRIVPIPAA